MQDKLSVYDKVKINVNSELKGNNNETEIKGKINLAPYEIIPFILAKCRNLNEVRALLSETEIIALPFSDNLPLSPLHWHIADKSGSLVLEKTADDGIISYSGSCEYGTFTLKQHAESGNLTEFAVEAMDLHVKFTQFKT